MLETSVISPHELVGYCLLCYVMICYVMLYYVMSCLQALMKKNSDVPSSINFYWSKPLFLGV